MTEMLNEEDLKKVTGGQIDWVFFSSMFMNEIKHYTTTLTVKHKELVEAIKDKDYSRVSVLALELSKTDATVANLMIKCRSQN